MTTLARSERHALCDLALVLGPAAPTLCEGWDATDLVAHLLVREHRPLGALGILVGPLSPLTDRAMAGYRRRDFGQLVEKLRTPGLTPYALPPLEKTLNTLEYVVHHEDLRRGQPDWQPRELEAADVEEVWAQVRRAAPLIGRALPAPVALRRADTGEEVTARRGSEPVQVSGPVVELVMFLFGRSATRGLDFDGPAAAVAAVRATGHRI